MRKYIADEYYMGTYYNIWHTGSSELFVLKTW